jgi:2-keto-4-pentenoate hydratase
VKPMNGVVVSVSGGKARSRAAVIVAARRLHWLLEPITDVESLTMDEAYAIQRIVLSERIARGESQIGWKLGYTSEAIRTRVGADRPNMAPLTDRMVITDESIIGDEMLQPRVAPEIALILDRTVPADVVQAQALSTVRELLIVLVIVDSLWRDYRHRIEDDTAAGSSVAHLALGCPLAAVDLFAENVVLEANGEVVATVGAGAALDQALKSLCWLSRELALRGDLLREGELVTTGALTPAISLRPRGAVHVRVGDRILVGVSRDRPRAEKPCDSDRLIARANRWRARNDA